MPVVGAGDISVGVLTLVQPVRAVVLYMAFWGFQTACLRPIAGQGMWGLLERAGNYGAPLALAWIQGWRRASAGAASTDRRPLEEPPLPVPQSAKADGANTVR
jgi:hypothetical protein